MGFPAMHGIFSDIAARPELTPVHTEYRLNDRHCPPFRERPAVIANLSARVGSISDNSLGGWYSYR